MVQVGTRYFLSRWGKPFTTTPAMTLIHKRSTPKLWGSCRIIQDPHLPFVVFHWKPAFYGSWASPNHRYEMAGMDFTLQFLRKSKDAAIEHHSKKTRFRRTKIPWGYETWNGGTPKSSSLGYQFRKPLYDPNKMGSRCSTSDWWQVFVHQLSHVDLRATSTPTRCGWTWKRSANWDSWFQSFSTCIYIYTYPISPVCLVTSPHYLFASIPKYPKKPMLSHHFQTLPTCCFSICHLIPMIPQAIPISDGFSLHVRTHIWSLKKAGAPQW